MNSDRILLVVTFVAAESNVDKICQKSYPFPYKSNFNNALSNIADATCGKWRQCWKTLYTKGLQIDIEHWVSHWNIEKIDIDIDTEYLFNVLIFHIDIELNSMFEIQYIKKLLNIFNVSMCLNVSQCFSMFFKVSQCFSIFLYISQYFQCFIINFDILAMKDSNFFLLEKIKKNFKF